MIFEEVMKELQDHADPHAHRNYLNHGADDHLFGVSVAQLRMLARKIKVDHHLAMELYQTGHFDAMHISAMISDPPRLTADDLSAMVSHAYCHILSDYVVASMTADAEFDLALRMSETWIEDEHEMTRSAGWTTLSMLVEKYDDTHFSQDRLRRHLSDVKTSFDSETVYVKNAMIWYIRRIGIFYQPLRQEALEIARQMAVIRLPLSKETVTVFKPYEVIQKAIKQGKTDRKTRSFR